MADVTVTPDTRFNANPTQVHTGLKVIGGEAMLGAYETGGVAMAIPGMNNVLGVLFDPTIAGYVLRYVPSTGKVLAYKQTGASGVLAVVASGTAMAATGTFWAFGF
uniref:Uncharacterized protein n=1 Tax=viral metagenome TaxID=1070528 RepID=A0A6M3L6L5_9ZZZZ